MHVPCLLVDVDTARPPRIECFGERRRCRPLGLDQREVRDSVGGELARDPPGAQRRELFRAEAAAVANLRFAAADSILDEVTTLAARCSAFADRDARHYEHLEGGSVVVTVRTSS